jgi:CBS-domain-containing membrane protein
MTKNPTTVSPETTIGEAVNILANASFRSLPVTDKDGKIVGILSNKDFIKVFNLWLNPKDDDKVYTSGGAGVAI